MRVWLWRQPWWSWRGAWRIGGNIRRVTVHDRHKGRHRSMLGNSNIIRDVNQSLWRCLFCSSTMNEWLARFIKYDIFADDNTSCCWIPESPCLCAHCIANHNAFGGVWLKMVSLGLVDMYISCWTKGSEVTDRGFIAMPRLKGSMMWECRCGRGVVDFNKCYGCFTPECEREVCIIVIILHFTNFLTVH